MYAREAAELVSSTLLSRDQSVVVAYMMNTTLWLPLAQFFFFSFFLERLINNLSCKVGDRQACLEVRCAVLMYHLLIELKFGIPYWRVSIGAQDHQNDLLPLTNAQVLCGSIFPWSLPFQC